MQSLFRAMRQNKRFSGACGTCSAMGTYGQYAPFFTAIAHIFVFYAKFRNTYYNIFS